MALERAARVSPARALTAMVLFLFWVLLVSSPAWSQQRDAADSQSTAPSSSGTQESQRSAGSVAGKVVDQSGTQIVGAAVELTHEGQSSKVEVTSDEDGRFVFYTVAAGAFRLKISFPGLTTQEFSGAVASGQHFVTPLIMMVIPTQVTEVHVGVPPEELANEQIKVQEKQRVFGVLPNFYVSYASNAAPLRAKHKFGLAWKSASDPITLAGVGFFAGVDQAANRWGAYGQGAQGYAKRFGATYVNVFAATFIGGAVMPSILKQDPRYFYKGTGSKRSRFLYAVASSVICKGDNGHWQPNYSNVIGSFAAAGIQNAYIPANDRQGSNAVLSSALIRIGETSLAGVLQEFVFSKLTRTKGTQRASLNQQQNP